MSETKKPHVTPDREGTSAVGLGVGASKADHAPPACDELLTKHGFVQPKSAPSGTVQINLPAEALTNLAAKAPLQQHAAAGMATATGVTYQKGRHRIVVAEDGTWTHVDKGQAVSHGGSLEALDEYLAEHRPGEARPSLSAPLRPSNYSEPRDVELDAKTRKEAGDVLEKHGFKAKEGESVYTHGAHTVTLDQSGRWSHRQGSGKEAKQVANGPAGDLDSHLTKELKTKDK